MYYIKLTYIVFIYSALKVTFNSEVRVSGCRNVGSKNALPYFTFIPMGKIVLNNAWFDLFEVFRKASPHKIGPRYITNYFVPNIA